MLHSGIVLNALTLVESRLNFGKMHKKVPTQGRDFFYTRAYFLKSITQCSSISSWVTKYTCIQTGVTCCCLQLFEVIGISNISAPAKNGDFIRFEPDSCVHQGITVNI